MNTTKNYQQLGYAVAVQALKDFFAGTEEGVEIVIDKDRKKILKKLKSPWMNFISNNLAWRLAEELTKNPEEVRRRFKKACAEETENNERGGN